MSLFEQSLKANAKPGRAVLDRLWLALANQRLGKTVEARRWLGKTRARPDRYRDGTPAGARHQDGMYSHNWPEARVPRREAEAPIQSKSPGNGTEN